MPCFFIFPWLYSIWGECAWFQYSRFRQNCKYFFGAAAVPPIRIKTASLQNKFTSLQTNPLHLRQPHSDSDKPAPPPSMSGSVTLLLQFFPLYSYETMKIISWWEVMERSIGAPPFPPMFHLRHCRDASLPNKPTSLQTNPLHFRQILPWADQLFCFCNSFRYIVMKSWNIISWWDVMKRSMGAPPFPPMFHLRHCRFSFGFLQYVCHHLAIFFDVCR